MIEELQLINFRCYRKHSIPLKKNTIIVGENNAGKSTIVEALRIISIIASKYKHTNYNKPPDWLDIPIGYKGVTPSLKEYDFHFESVSYRYNKRPAQIKVSFTTGESIEVYIGGEGKIFAVIRDKNKNAIKTKNEASVTNLPAVLILPEISPLLLEEKSLLKTTLNKTFSHDYPPVILETNYLFTKNNMKNLNNLWKLVGKGVK